MPLKDGRLTEQEKRFVQHVVETGNPSYAARQSGYKSRGAVAQTMSRPAIQQAISEAQIVALHNEILPLAVAAHKRLLSDPKTPSGAVVQAIKLAYDRTLGTQENAGDKEPHEMNAAELANAIQNLERIKSEKARPVIEGSTNDPDVFE